MIAVADYPDTDPVTALAQWLTAVDVTRAVTAVNLRRNERNRLGLLIVHGIAALTIAPGFAAQLAAPGGMDSPSFAVLRHIPGAPYSLAFVLGLGGAVLLPATIARHRTWEMCGLALLIGWYGCMAVTLAGAFVPWAAAGADPAARPSIFAPALYAHLMTIMGVHMRTLWTMRRRES